MHLQKVFFIYFQAVPVKKRRLQYDRGNLALAYDAALKGMSVCSAAKRYQVPESTLRDRTRGNVTLDAKNGHGTLFTMEEEKMLVDHLSYMADIGYGYQKSKVQYMARDFAAVLGKDIKNQEYLSNCWFYGFIGRWPEMKVVKPQKLTISRAKSASSEVLGKYYQELGTILKSNNLMNKPERIWNIDETGVPTEHSPPKIVCNIGTNPQAVTSPRGSTITVIAAGNAIGNSIPPYYVYPGKRWNDDFLSGAPAGSDGEMTKSGWSNMEVFQNYLTKHFMKYSNISSGSATEPSLILYDGHRSHISLALTDWAKRNNVILFVLPPHTSHLTQPLDVAIFSPFKTMFNRECQSYMRNHPGLTITKYQVAALTHKPYLKSLTAENLASAFRKTGIYPFNSKVMTASQVAPATIYRSEVSMETDETQQPNVGEDADAETQQLDHTEDLVTLDIIDNQEEKILTQPCESNKTPAKEATPSLSKSDDFFKARTITSVVKPKQKKKFVPPLLTGNLFKSSVTETLKEQAIRKMEKPVTKQSVKGKGQTPKKINSVQPSFKSNSNLKPKIPTNTIQQPVPSTSGLYNKKNLQREDITELTSCSEDSEEEEEKCCMCGKWEPEAIRECASVIFVKWAKCDHCSHWTHLHFCSQVKFLRRGSEFRCPHCIEIVQ